MLELIQYGIQMGMMNMWKPYGFPMHSRLHGLLVAAKSKTFPDSVGHFLMQLRHAEDFYLNIIITHQGTENKIMAAI